MADTKQPKPPETPFQRFEDLARKIIRAPKPKGGKKV